MARGRDEHEARKDELNSFGKQLARRCKSQCELCSENTSLSIFEVPPVAEPDVEKCVMICDTCREQVEDSKKINVNHWHCLNDSAWSEVPAVQVLVWRLLKQLSDQPWAQDLADQLYLDEEILEWANDDGSRSSGGKTLDSNGTELIEGDTVTIIKDLDVRGAGFTAKRGTVVKNIHLTGDPAYIEGRVNKTKLVLKTCFMKKA
jgi:protein PhnA